MISNLDIPELANADVVISGGGPAGVAAALAAARNGASTVLLEQTGCCGGMSTAGLVPVFIHMSDRRHMVAAGICEEVVGEMVRRMGLPAINPIWQHINPEILKRIYDEKLQQAGVRVFYAVKVADVIGTARRVNALAVATCRGLKRVTGRIFIDATGDGMVAAQAGVPFERGDAEGRTMSPTLCSQYSNIDLAAMRAGEERGEGALVQWKRHLAEIPLQERHLVGVSEYGNATASGNLGHIYGADATEESSLSAAYAEGRRVAKIIHDFYVKWVPGFGASDLTATAALLGVRESRRVEGDYRITFADYRARRHYEDEIGVFYYPIDIHASRANAAEQQQVGQVMEQSAYEPGENYGIPYRALCCRGKDNLLMAGRCISCEREVQASLRVMPCCMITGAGAGTAAALTAAAGDIRKLDAEVLREKLRSQGAYLG